MRINRLQLVVSIIVLATLAGSSINGYQGNQTGQHSQRKGYSVQVGSTPTEENAKSEVNRLKQHGQTSYYVKAEIPEKGVFYRIRVGRFATAEAARTQAELMRRSNLIHDFLVTSFEGPNNLAFTDTAYGNTAQAMAVVKRSQQDQTPKESPRNSAVSSPTPTNTSATPAKTAATTSKPSGAVTPPTSIPAAPAQPGIERVTAVKTDSNPVPPPTSLHLERPRTVETNPANSAKSPASANAPATNYQLPLSVTGLARPADTSAGTAVKSDTSANASNPATNKAPAPVVAKSNVPPVSMAGAKPSGAWESQISLTNQTLRKVFFVNEHIGWVVGDGGTILHTMNGGRTWQRQLSGVAINLTEIFFINETTGWALGGGTRGADLRDLQNPEELVLLRTVDGGKMWERQTGVNALAISFLNPQKGWRVGNYGEVWRTEDGGKTWQAAAKPDVILGTAPQSAEYVFAFTGVTFINEQEGWLIGNNYGDAKSYIGGLFRTKDGGHTWERVQLKVNSVKSDATIAGSLREVHFTDSKHGFISAEIASATGDSKATVGVMLQTSDGGQTWQEQPLQVNGLAAIHMVDKQYGWSAALSDQARSTEVMYTANGGASWVEGVKSEAAIYSLYFPTSVEGWAVGAKGTILHFSKNAKAAPTSSLKPAN